MENKTLSEELREAARDKEREAQELHKLASEAHKKELLEKPLIERMVYAAESRCECGLGLAYDPAHPDGVRGAWRCSGVILYASGIAPEGFKVEPIHSPPLPFMFYEIKSEDQPSAGGRTTRP